MLMLDAYLTGEMGLNGSLLAEYLLESTNSAIIVQDRTGVVAWNPLAISILGLTDGNLRGDEPIDDGWTCVYPNGQTMPIDERPAARVLAGGPPIRGEIAGIHHANGQLTWVQVTVLPIFGPTGDVRAAFSMLADVSEVQKTAHALAQAEERFRNWFEDGLSANLVVDHGGRLIAWNQAAIDLLQRGDDEMFDLECADVLVLDLTATLEMLSEDSARDDYVEGATDVLTPDGREIEVDAHVVRIEWPLHPNCVMIQMTQHSKGVQTGRHANNWHRSAFEDSFTSMMLLGDGMRIAVANRSCGSLIEERSIDLVGRPLASLVSVAGTTIDDIGDEVRRTGTMLQFDEAALLSVNGVRPIVVRFSPATDDASQILVQLISLDWNKKEPSA